jgi:hypothetical protein
MTAHSPEYSGGHKAARHGALEIEFVDILLPRQNAPIRFTFLRVEDDRWEGKDYTAAGL